MIGRLGEKKRDAELPGLRKIADGVLNSKSGTTYQVTQLEKAGLVRRRSSQVTVTRCTRVSPMSGARLVEEAAPGHVALVRELLIDVLTREQLSALADSLGEVSRRMLVSPPDGPAARSAQAAARAQILSPRAL